VAVVGAIAYLLLAFAGGRLGVSAFLVRGSETAPSDSAPRVAGPILSRSAVAGRTRAVRMALAPGDALGDFSFTNQDGMAVTRESLKGQRALFWIYPKADTGG
jgi:hypothetical protein